ncbi:endonuclease/exonuclease/phosphatase family protein [Streptomyces sp. NPDC059567]|uniref:endonuclease/exonuclease/phosphatase family protein n=1 Tax=Streptomyces sp. NPDC059567 TaxID=3346867 RepID=UPI0036904E57
MASLDRYIDADLRVATWNVHEAVPEGGTDDIFQGGESAYYSRSVTDMLLEGAIDVIGMQEVGFSGEGRSELLDLILETTPLRHVAAFPLHASSFFPGRLSGVAIASRFPLRDVHRHRLPNPGLSTRFGDDVIHSHDKGLVSAVCESDAGVRLDIATVHSFPFHLFGREATETEFTPVWKSLAARLGELSAQSLLVCGDFNAEHAAELLAARGLPLGSAMTGTTTYRGSAVDDVLHGSGFRLVSSSTVPNLSDHCLCLAKLHWSDPPSGPSSG